VGGDQEAGARCEADGAAHPGEAVQVDPIKPVSKAPSDELFSIFAFKFNLRHYIQALKGEEIKAKIKAFTTKANTFRNELLKRPMFQYDTGYKAAYPMVGAYTRPLFSST
jgi:hypothetical protein